MKKTIMRLVSFALSATLLLSIMPSFQIKVNATTVASGSCGDNITWELDVLGNMKLNGSGAMSDYGLFTETWDGNYVYSLQDQPWHDERSKIKSLVIGEGITYIGETAFASCKNLTSVSFPDSIVYIGNAAFQSCSALEVVSLPKGIRSIGILAFSDCHSLTRVDIPLGIELVEKSAFSECGALTVVNYGGSEKDWGKITIEDKNWQVVNADINYEKYVLVDASVIASGNCGDNVTWILTSDGALTIAGYGPMEGWGNYKKVPWYPYANQIISVNIRSGVTTVGSCSFAGCHYMESAVLPDTITKVYDGAFSVCKKLTSITIPDGVKSIGSDAFAECKSLASIYIPKSVSSISFEAFDGCDNLKDIYYSGSVSEWGEIKVYGDNEPLFTAQIHPNSALEVSEADVSDALSDNNFTKRIKKITITYSDGSIGGTDFNYDEKGLLVSTNAVTPYSTQETYYSYDNANRLISIQIDSDAWYAIGPKAEYVYDNNGRLIKSSEAEGSRITRIYEYDQNGKCVRSSSEGEGMSYASEYRYSDDSLTIEEVLTKTDYEGNATKDYITYSFSEDGKIVSEVCSGAYSSYTRIYEYNNKPVVAISENGNTPFSIYLPDKMGHPIWEIEYFSVATMQNDVDGYINRIITDYGDIYDFEYEVLSNQAAQPDDENITTSGTAENEYVLEVYSIDRNLSVKPGSELQLICSLYHEGELVENWGGVSWGFVTNSEYGDIIEITKHEKIDVGYRLFVKGLREGETTLNISETTSGATILLDIKVGNQYAVPVGCSLDGIPNITLDQIGDFGTQVNFYNYNGLYISDFNDEYNRKTDKYSISFNVYNRSYMHGSIDVYDKDGIWIGSKKIDKHENVKGVVDTLYGGTVALAEWCTGQSFSYKASTYTTKTSIDIEVPSGGYFTISNNMAHSPGVFIYNGIDYFVQILSAANDVAFKAIDVAAIQNKTIEKLLKDDDFLMTYQETIVNMTINASGDALEKGYVDTVSSIVDSMVDYIGSAITESIGATVGMAEKMVLGMIPPQFTIWLDVIFGISTVSDSLGQAIDMCRSVNKTYINIYTPEASGQLTVEGVQVTPEDNAIPENAMLRVCRLPNNDAITAEKIGVETEDYQLYDISFTSDGVEVELDGSATVKLPVPQSKDWTEYAVLHQQSDGSWELVESKLEQGYLIVKVDHFSLFAIVNGADVEENREDRANSLIIIVISIIAVGAISMMFIRFRTIRRRRRTRRGGKFLKNK